MGLAAMLFLRKLLLRDFSGEQHAAGLSADGAASDHPVPKGKIIRRAKILPDQLLHALVLCHRALDDLRLGLLREASRRILQPGKGEKAVIAVRVQILQRGLLLLPERIIAADAKPVLHHLKPPLSLRSFHPYVGQEHVGKIPVTHL